jgi:REP element-mobilizing transposase RayT
MPRPLAYFISWTTYGTWLPGDERGWVDAGKVGVRTPNPSRREFAEEQMADDPVLLTVEQRRVVHETVEAHCKLRGWKLYAVNARTNHVHVVVTADCDPETVMNQLKAWCSRRLNERFERRAVWWTRHGSTKWINDEEYLHNALHYVLNRQ